MSAEQGNQDTNVEADFSVMDTQQDDQKTKKQRREVRRATLRENIALYSHTLVSLATKLFGMFETNAGIQVAEEIISVAMKGATVTRLATQTKEAVVHKRFMEAFLYGDLTGIATTNYIVEQVNKIKAQQLRDYTEQLKQMKEAHGV